MTSTVPLHQTGDTAWTKRALELVDLWTTNASINPDGFRQPRTGKRKNGRGKTQPKTRLDRISDLENKLA